MRTTQARKPDGAPSFLLRRRIVGRNERSAVPARRTGQGTLPELRGLVPAYDYLFALIRVIRGPVLATVFTRETGVIKPPPRR